MNNSRKLYFISGTVWFRSDIWVAVLDFDHVMHWLSRKMFEAEEGQVLWLIYSKTGTVTNKVESIIPFEQATREDLLKDFDEEGNKKPNSDH